MQNDAIKIFSNLGRELELTLLASSYWLNIRVFVRLKTSLLITFGR